MTVGERIPVEATVENAGGDGSIELRLEADGTTVGGKLVTVPADSEITTELRTEPTPAPGSFVLALNGTELGEVTVESEE